MGKLTVPSCDSNSHAGRGFDAVGVDAVGVDDVGGVDVVGGGGVDV